MIQVVRNVGAFLIGLVLGSIVNMGIIMSSGYVIPAPKGVDVTSAEGLLEGMHLMEPKHYIFPFLAHAIGVFVGALITYKVAKSFKVALSLWVGAVFLLGGIYSVSILPAPLWFSILDLIGAYLPFACLAIWVGKRSD